jgi:hypothetical protein
MIDQFRFSPERYAALCKIADERIAADELATAEAARELAAKTAAEQLNREQLASVLNRPPLQAMYDRVVKTGEQVRNRILTGSDTGLSRSNPHGK